MLLVHGGRRPWLRVWLSQTTPRLEQEGVLGFQARCAALWPLSLHRPPFCPHPLRPRQLHRMAGRTPRVLVLALVCLGLVLWHADILLPSSPLPPSDPLPPLQRPLLSTPPLPPPPSPPPPTFLKSFTPSTHDLPLQGYNVFSHLYLFQGKLVYAPRNGKTARKVERADVVSGEVELADGRFEQVEDGKVWFAGLEGKEEGVEVIKGHTVRAPPPPSTGFERSEEDKELNNWHFVCLIGVPQ